MESQERLNGKNGNPYLHRPPEMLSPVESARFAKSRHSVYPHGPPPPLKGGPLTKSRPIGVFKAKCG